MVLSSSCVNERNTVRGNVVWNQNCGIETNCSNFPSPPKTIFNFIFGEIEVETTNKSFPKIVFWKFWRALALTKVYCNQRINCLKITECKFLYCGRSPILPSLTLNNWMLWTKKYPSINTAVLCFSMNLTFLILFWLVRVKFVFFNLIVWCILRVNVVFLNL